MQENCENNGSWKDYITIYDNFMKAKLICKKATVKSVEETASKKLTEIPENTIKFRPQPQAPPNSIINESENKMESPLEKYKYLFLILIIVGLISLRIIMKNYF
jgi:hypothetical protein